MCMRCLKISVFIREFLNKSRDVTAISYTEQNYLLTLGVTYLLSFAFKLPLEILRRFIAIPHL